MMLRSTTKEMCSVQSQRHCENLFALLHTEPFDFYVDNFEVHGVEVGIPTAVFHGYLTTSSSLSREQVITLVAESDDVKLYHLSKIGSLPSTPVASELPGVYNCSNGGILLPNSTCVCPAFVSGAQCEIITCQNSGILDKGRCTCPPGFYALNCESRGCMPSVQSNLDTSRQSFILVLSLRSSMGYDLHQLIEQVMGIVTANGPQHTLFQLPTWISDIGKAAPGLIDNFIVTTYLQYSTHSKYIFTKSKTKKDGQ
ncbi:hypothetical protein OSTOST_18764 [Ostertagia ostertagi]